MAQQSVKTKAMLANKELADRVPSPCIGICSLDREDECLGCARTLAEITDWGVMDNQQKREVLQRIERQYPR